MSQNAPSAPPAPVSAWAKWLALAAGIIVIDQITKCLIVLNFQLGDAVPITGFFNIVRAHNTGAAFSFLANAGGWQRWFFTAVGLGAAVLITWLLRRHHGQKLFSFALAMILGGAIGNVIDRVWHGYVVDFLDFYFPFLSGLFYGGHFPAFNVADMAISCGAFCLILDELLRWKNGTNLPSQSS